jgi:hypothetical protein
LPFQDLAPILNWAGQRDDSGSVMTKAYAGRGYRSFIWLLGRIDVERPQTVQSPQHVMSAASFLRALGDARLPSS